MAVKDVLFLGPYKQRDGWGRAAKDYLTALKQTGHNIVSKHIHLSNAYDPDIGNDLYELEHNKFSQPSADVVIQNVLPHYLDYDGRCGKNIGLFYVETSHFPHLNWVVKMNLMDELWVATLHEREALRNSGVTIPIEVIGMPFDIESLRVNDVEPLMVPEINDCFVFYFIGEYIERKNLEALIIAYHREFKRTEPVALMIKTNRSGVNSHDVQRKVVEDLNNIKAKMRLYSSSDQYLPEVIVTNHLSPADLLALHKQCDCMVMPSRGESVCRPLIEAMCAGNMVIATGETGMTDAVSYGGWEIDAQPVPAFVGDSPLPNLYTSHEIWSEISIIDLQKCMREAYTMTEKNRKLRQNSNEKVLERYTYQYVANRINKLI